MCDIDVLVAIDGDSDLEFPDIQKVALDANKLPENQEFYQGTDTGTQPEHDN